ncbi:MAG: prepilin peptidase [Methanobrevibacter sp.]|jgi:preflagellin peptidase FlaK|nr:prepilin peptidase [Candidatus Methanoflexus mossambicus]
MNLYVIPTIAIIFSTILASYSDIKYRIIPNKLNFLLIFSGIAYNLFLTIIFNNLFYIFMSLFSGVLIFIISYIFWNLGLWGGGDLKLITGIGFLLPIQPYFIDISNIFNISSIINIPIVNFYPFIVSVFLNSFLVYLPFVFIYLFILNNFKNNFKNKNDSNNIKKSIKTNFKSWNKTNFNSNNFNSNNFNLNNFNLSNFKFKINIFNNVFNNVFNNIFNNIFNNVFNNVFNNNFKRINNFIYFFIFSLIFKLIITIVFNFNSLDNIVLEFFSNNVLNSLFKIFLAIFDVLKFALVMYIIVFLIKFLFKKFKLFIKTKTVLNYKINDIISGMILDVIKITLNDVNEKIEIENTLSKSDNLSLYDLNDIKKNYIDKVYNFEKFFSSNIFSNIFSNSFHNRSRNSSLNVYHNVSRYEKTAKLNLFSLDSLFKKRDVDSSNGMNDEVDEIEYFEYILKTRSAGVSNNDIIILKELSKKKFIDENVNVKIAIPFAPGISLGFLFAIIFGDLTQLLSFIIKNFFKYLFFIF